MGRPREHDLGELLDHARALWVERGTAGLTIRALSSRSGVSSGAIYNAFGSREHLLARAWAREARAFLTFQCASVDDALGRGDARQGVLAASLALADYADAHEEAARLLMAVDVGTVLAFDLDAAARADLDGLRSDLGALIVRLSRALWTRTDAEATGLVTMCVVDLPGRLLLSRGRIASPLARHALAAAVNGITGVDPPPTTQTDARGSSAALSPP